MLLWFYPMSTRTAKSNPGTSGSTEGQLILFMGPDAVGDVPQPNTEAVPVPEKVTPHQASPHQEHAQYLEAKKQVPHTADVPRPNSIAVPPPSKVTPHRISRHQRHAQCLKAKRRVRHATEIPESLKAELQRLADQLDWPMRLLTIEAIQLGLRSVKRRLRRDGEL